jgi:hypothetical protein
MSITNSFESHLGKYLGKYLGNLSVTVGYRSGLYRASATNFKKP